MTGYIEAGRVSGIGESSLTRVESGGRTFLLARTGGWFYATDLLCPHLQADLSKGTLHGTILTCPMHNPAFDLRDGHVVRWTNLAGIVLTSDKKTHPPRPLKCYPVRVDGDRILIDIS